VLSRPIRRWYWRISISPRSQTRFRRRRNCLPNSGWPTGQSSRWMLCIAKKTFEVAAEANIALIVQVKDNQPTLNRRSRKSPRQRPDRCDRQSYQGPQSRRTAHHHGLRSGRKVRHTECISTSQRSFASNARCSPHRFEWPVDWSPRPLLRLEHNAHRCERHRRHSRSLEVETTSTTAATSPSARTNHASVPTPACCSSPQLRLQHPQVKQKPARSARTATALLWRASITCLKSWPFHSVEQPCCWVAWAPSQPPPARWRTTVRHPAAADEPEPGNWLLYRHDYNGKLQSAEADHHREREIASTGWAFSTGCLKATRRRRW